MWRLAAAAPRAIRASVAAALLAPVLLAPVLLAPSATAAGPAEEPRFVLTVKHQGRGDGFSFQSTTTTSYRRCDRWDGGRWGVAPTSAGSSVLDDQGISASAGAGMAGRQAAGTPRALFAQRRSLLGLRVGESLPFCVERAAGSGQDAHGSSVTSVTDETGATRTSGVYLDDAQPRPFSSRPARRASSRPRSARPPGAAPSISRSGRPPPTAASSSIRSSRSTARPSCSWSSPGRTARPPTSARSSTSTRTSRWSGACCT